ncbi:hypothetical protein NPIL_149151 [Nephila pilipes]|uniref:Uncharacterized protein n=1 Tax=Nephila pilipes TaxID=299642 RepID=A0A8X6NF22_NEPPI|nr:hypothetical protein NPIL_149151 [Nephila pilipes]
MLTDVRRCLLGCYSNSKKIFGTSKDVRRETGVRHPRVVGLSYLYASGLVETEYVIRVLLDCHIANKAVWWWSAIVGNGASNYDAALSCGMAFHSYGPNGPVMRPPPDGDNDTAAVIV